MLWEALTLRELEVVECLAQGLSNVEIARAMFLSDKTVKAHLAVIFRKMGATNRTHLLVLLIKRGIVTIEPDSLEQLAGLPRLRRSTPG